MRKKNKFFFGLSFFLFSFVFLTNLLFASQNILLISGHTDIKNSIANKTIIENLKKEFENLEVSSLCELYPDYKIDVKAEQEKLKKADIIIVQFPFFWYNAPSILRKYFEDVLTHGFAFGKNGKSLKNKKFIVSFTIGGQEKAYTKKGTQNFEIKEFMPSFQQLANMCNMKWSGFIYSTGYLFTADNDTKIKIAQKHSQDLIKKITKLK